MSFAIRVEKLSKKYLLRRQTDGRSHYFALRDVLTHKFTSLFRRDQNSPGGQEEFWALKDVSFEIEQGEAVGIIGRNGAGKSTLLKLLSRITDPTEGRIEIEGRVASLLEVGTGFHPELTGRENIFLNGAVLGMTRMEIKRKFDEIVAFAEVDKFLDTPVKRYSSGMYMRMAFAVAAHLEPEILVVDEVLAVGDAQFQKKCLGKMRDVAKGGRTVLFVSHNMAAVRNLCVRGILLDKGRLKFEGLSEETISRYVESGLLEAGGLSWVRPAATPIEAMGFETIQVSLEGQQPQMRLNCDIVLRSLVDGSPVFVAVDICDPSLTPIMQALPRARPFISGDVGWHRLSLEIELPPLIPGLYTADFWMGSHFSRTVDYIKNRICFEVVEAPSTDRNFPYSSEHGFAVPVSRCRVERVTCHEAIR